MLYDPPIWRVLVFGATGAVGGAFCETASARGWHVTGSSRGDQPTRPGAGPIAWLRYDPFGSPATGLASGLPTFDAVCWAQGANMADNAYDVEDDVHLDLYRANCLFILRSLRGLLLGGHLAKAGARLCVVGSIWQERARQNKLSYTMTKAAIAGLVRSASVDLAADGHLINAVLPGVLDTPMTRSNLSAAQLEGVQAATPGGRLATLDAVCELMAFLCSRENTGLTGHCAPVDLGFSNARLV